MAGVDGVADQRQEVVAKQVERPERMQENLDVFDFALREEEVAFIGALDTHKQAGRDPDSVNRWTGIARL